WGAQDPDGLLSERGTDLPPGGARVALNGRRSRRIRNPRGQCKEHLPAGEIDRSVEGAMCECNRLVGDGKGYHGAELTQGIAKAGPTAHRPRRLERIRDIGTARSAVAHRMRRPRI